MVQMLLLILNRPSLDDPNAASYPSRPSLDGSNAAAYSDRPFLEDKLLKIRGFYRSPTARPPSEYRWVPLVPAEDMHALAPKDFAPVFWQRNAALQLLHFNKGLWQQLEAQVRQWATTYKEVYVVTGAVFLPPDRPLPKLQASLPSHFFKILLVLSTPEPQAVAFLLPHSAKLKGDIWTYALPLREAEAKTGLALLSKHTC